MSECVDKKISLSRFFHFHLLRDRILSGIDFTLFYPHVTFKILPEGNLRKAIENEISVKVFLDVETVNILDEFDLEDDI